MNAYSHRKFIAFFLFLFILFVLFYYFNQNKKSNTNHLGNAIVTDVDEQDKILGDSDISPLYGNNTLFLNDPTSNNNNANSNNNNKNKNNDDNDDDQDSDEGDSDSGKKLVPTHQRMLIIQLSLNLSVMG